MTAFSIYDLDGEVELGLGLGAAFVEEAIAFARDRGLRARSD